VTAAVTAAVAVAAVAAAIAAGAGTVAAAIAGAVAVAAAEQDIAHVSSPDSVFQGQRTGCLTLLKQQVHRSRRRRRE